MRSERTTYSTGLCFPKLMVHTEATIIVLFQETKKGMVLNNSNTLPDRKFKVGLVKEDWEMRMFKDFHGKIELIQE